MKYIINARNFGGGRKTYVKASREVNGGLIYKGFTRTKRIAFHWDSYAEAIEALKSLKVAYEHKSFGIEEHLPTIKSEGLITEPADSLMVAAIRAIHLFPEVPFENLRYSDGFFRNMDIFEVWELIKSWREAHTYSITVRCGEVHILIDDKDQASFWASFM